jgi:hypothetical protein
MALGRYKEAEEAASAGLRVDSEHQDLQRVRNGAIAARNEGLIHPGRSTEDEPDLGDPDEPDRPI